MKTLIVSNCYDFNIFSAQFQRSYLD
uniref:Uncharacterized protein n=1 Tax=Anguilla anguilla TaxID=7936 RepID=A0A0E9U308_ANGAN